jgi:hypothetical protein
MHDLLPAVEKNAREISIKAANTLGVLAAADRMPGPGLYYKVIRNVSELRPVWTEHLHLLSQAYPLVPTNDARVKTMLRRFQQDLVDTGQWLNTMSTVGWARTPEIGVNSIRFRATETLTTILIQMERERTMVVPLLRCATPQTAPAGPTEVVAAAVA